MEIYSTLMTNYPITISAIVDRVNGSDYAEGDKMKTIVLIKGDSGYNLNFNLYQADEITPLSLADATVIFAAADSVNVSSLVLVATCTISDPGMGQCYYKVQSSDFGSLGIYRAKLVATYTSGEILTARGININVIEGL